MSSELQEYRDHCRRESKKPGADPLWAVLADEVDRYLERDEQDEPLC